MPPNGKEFIKNELEASYKRMKDHTGTWEDEMVALAPLIAPLIDHAAVQDRVLIHMLEEFSELKSILKTFVEQRLFMNWVWKGVAGVLGVNGVVALIFQILQIKKCM